MAPTARRAGEPWPCPIETVRMAPVGRRRTASSMAGARASSVRPASRAGGASGGRRFDRGHGSRPRRRGESGAAARQTADARSPPSGHEALAGSAGGGNLCPARARAPVASRAGVTQLAECLLPKHVLGHTSAHLPFPHRPPIDRPGHSSSVPPGISNVGQSLGKSTTSRSVSSPRVVLLLATRETGWTRSAT